MAVEEEMEKLKEATLRRLQLEPVSAPTEPTLQVVATVLGPREEPLEEPMRESLATQLAGRAHKAIEEKAEGRRPIGVLTAEVAYSDHANCEGPQGRPVNAFIVGERCYRIVLRVALGIGSDHGRQ